MRVCMVVGITVALLCGCTVERFHRDVGVTLDYARFKNSTEVRANQRWQLRQQSVVRVRELAPSIHESWASAAQAGVERVFPPAGEGSAVDRPAYELLVAWPESLVAGANAGKGGFSPHKMIAKDPLRIRVLLTDESGHSVQSAQIQVYPHLFAGSFENPGPIQHAFSRYAGQLVGRH